MVTWPAVPASAGTSVIAVAPLPITTTSLPGQVEVGGPVLRVDHLPGEVVGARELRRERLLVVVVAGRAPQHPGGHQHPLAVAVDLDRPGRGRRVPAGPDHAVPVADQLVDAVLAGDGAQVVEDRRPVGQRLGAGPGPPAEAEGEHVGVGADAGVAEQVPRAAAGLPRLEDRDRLASAGARAAGRPRRCPDRPAPTISTSTCSVQARLGLAYGGRAHALRQRAYSWTKRARMRGGSVTTAARAWRISSSPSPGPK